VCRDGGTHGNQPKVQQIAEDQQPAVLRFDGVQELAEPLFTALEGEGIARPAVGSVKVTNTEHWRHCIYSKG
jgi:hypothetical protein